MIFLKEIDDYNQAIKLDPENILAYNARAHTKNHIGDYKGAKDDYSKILKIDPNNSDAYTARGKINLKLKISQAAYEDFIEVIRLAPKDLGANIGLAEYYRDKGLLDKAGEHIQNTGLIAEDSWIVLGPFDNIGKIGLETAYIPENATHFDTTVKGEEVYAHTETHKAVMDRYVFPVTLKPGKNSILVKVCEEEFGWGFYLRITDKNGQAFDDLEINRATQVEE